MAHRKLEEYQEGLPKLDPNLVAHHKLEEYLEGLLKLDHNLVAHRKLGEHLVVPHRPEGHLAVPHKQDQINPITTPQVK